MGYSGKFAVITGIVAAGLLVLTGMTLAEPVFVAFAGVLALACLACIMEILNRGRRLALLAAGAGTSLTIAFSLAFLSTWERAFSGESSFIGTPLPTGDPDNYFFAAAGAALGTLLVLFLGTAWPVGRRLRSPGGKATMAKRRAATAAGRPGAAGTRQRKPTLQRAAGAAGQRGTPPRAAGGGTGGLRAPAGSPAAAAKRPSSSASPSTKPAPRSGSGAASRR
ncbi:hypothetical protein [Pseudarthrobacter sp. NamB4]|uniref:hypothetical protein n=1 Tax=Pseudarthrobacter sp. NamB4 TaxID=2576837 RepID=UPI001485538D|nr:hypothetical protein [Pseudarthrobacter sp. NamB4]